MANSAFDAIARENFGRASRKAFWRKFYHWVTGGSSELLPYDEIRQRTQIQGQHYIGLQTIEIDKIVGSVGRYHEFDREFSPTQNRTRERWLNIDRAHLTQVHLPPIDVYQVNDVFFVKDGNHRVSVARERGQRFIDAYVVQVELSIEITPETRMDEIELKNAAAAFLKETGLNEIIVAGKSDSRTAFYPIHLTLPEAYHQLWEHIRAHQWFTNQADNSNISEKEAAASWYLLVYIPLVKLIRENNLVEKVSGRTETDLYLLVSEYQWLLRETYQGDKALDDAVQTIKTRYEKYPTTQVTRTLRRAYWIDDLILSGERAYFLKTTQITQIKPDADITLTLPGKYPKILDQISVHRWYLGEAQQTEKPYSEAVASWYDNVYLPLVMIIREGDILASFPDRTEADLYVWIIDHRARLKEELGWELSPETVAQDLVSGKEREKPSLGQILNSMSGVFLDAASKPGSWREERSVGRRTGSIFREALVTIGPDAGTSGFKALEQALKIVKSGWHEWPILLYGLHVVPIGTDWNNPTVEAIKERFNQTCLEAGVSVGGLALAEGRAADRLIERARWADLLVVNLNYPPMTTGIARLGSGFRKIIRGAGRPVLAVPGQARPPDRLLLAYDGSPKADEGLFIATHFVKAWDSKLAILTVGSPELAIAVLNRAGEYLQTYGVLGIFIQKEGQVVDTILEVAHNDNYDWIVVGGYGETPVMELMWGSTLDQLLIKTTLPVLICS